MKYPFKGTNKLKYVSTEKGCKDRQGSGSHLYLEKDLFLTGLYSRFLLFNDSRCSFMILYPFFLLGTMEVFSKDKSVSLNFRDILYKTLEFH